MVKSWFLILHKEGQSAPFFNFKRRWASLIGTNRESEQGTTQIRTRYGGGIEEKELFAEGIMTKVY
jgi:hypothetical protein